MEKKQASLPFVTSEYDVNWSKDSIRITYVINGGDNGFLCSSAVQ